MNTNRKNEPQGSRSANTRTVLRYLAFGFGVSALVLVFGLDLFLLGCTMVSGWWVFGLCILVGAFTAIPAAPRWRKLSGWSGWVPNILFHTLVVAVVLPAIFLGVNYWGASEADFTEEKAVVESKERVTRRHTRRVGRRYLATGSVYYVYQMEVRFVNPEYGVLTVPAPKSKYNAIGKGDTALIEVGRGALGFYVIDEPSVRPLHPHKKKSRPSRRPRYVRER